MSTNGKLVWVDLSTFNVDLARNFYGKIFGWSFSGEGAGYLNGSLAGNPCAGLYLMPSFFRKIGMPSFWMSYIAVDDVESTVAEARALGGKIELEEQGVWGKVALIRDPAGAGFTCYQGSALKTQINTNFHGTWLRSELFVSDASKVAPFYTALFGWDIRKESRDRYAFFHNQGEKIASLRVVSNEIRGEKEFWAVYFTVDDPLKTVTLIEQTGGKVHFEEHNNGETHYHVYDNQGAFFLILPKQKDVEVKRSPTKKTFPFFSKWKSLAGLVFVYFTILTEQNWGWGCFILLWVFPDLKSGKTHFFQPLDKRSDPFLYWTVICTWLLMAAYLLTDFFRLLE